MAKPISVWLWIPQRDGELVPDHPPVDITDYIADFRIEEHADGGVSTDGCRRVCAEEGYDELVTTPLGAAREHLRCRRCGERWTGPRDAQ
jgi:hypothetical protein